MKRNLEIWHRITKDLKIEELEKPDLSLIKTTKYWIKGVLSGRTNTTSANNTFEHYDYQIYNEYLEIGQISEMHLTCESFRDTYENMTSGVTTEFSIYDYYKNKNVISQHSNSRLPLVCNEGFMVICL
jgi:hypothetical protein